MEFGSRPMVAWTFGDRGTERPRRLRPHPRADPERLEEHLLRFAAAKARPGKWAYPAYQSRRRMLAEP
jgi:hypothetical protein